MSETFQDVAAAPGVSAGFDEAFTLHHRAVFRAAHSIVRDPGLAEDVTQEVFLKLHKHMDSIPSDEMLRPWLLRVALNLAKNSVRGQSRSVAREQEFFKRAELAGNHVAEPESDLERRASLEEARRALDKIREPMRSCLLLKHQGFSYREIAEALAVNEVNVGSLVARGRKEFARHYGKIGGTR